MEERKTEFGLGCACLCTDRRCGFNSIFDEDCRQIIHDLSRFVPTKEGYCRGIMVVDDNTVRYLDCPKKEGVENYTEVAEVNWGRLYY